MSTVLGIDVGTQSVKVLVYCADTKQCKALASAPLALHQNRHGVAEQQAKWWIDGLQAALKQIEPNVLANLAAIGVSGQQHGFVPIDAKGQPLVPVKLWCDTSTTDECDYLTAQMGGEDACIAELGNPILPGYTASKLLWFRNAHADLYAQMDCVLLPHDYVNFYLTGEKTMEAGDASGTGFMDVRARQWSQQMLGIVDPNTDLRDRLPRIGTSMAPIGKLLPSVASELGLPPGIPVAPGGGDNMMGAIGTGNVKPGMVTMSLGTSGTIYSYADVSVTDPNGDIAAFCSSTGGWLPLICTMNCTAGTQLMQDLFATTISQFEANVKISAHGAQGVIAVPFFNGERTPNLPSGKACLFGLDGQNMRQENILRATVEGVTFGLRAGLDLLANQGLTAQGIVLTGGGAKSPAWRQIVADICNAPVKVLTNPEAAALGAALQALTSLTGADIRKIAGEHLATAADAYCLPQRDVADFYREHYQSYRQAAAHVQALYREGRPA